VGQAEVVSAEEPSLLDGLVTSRSHAVSTSLSVVTSSGAGSAGSRAEVKLELPQELVDPDRRLSTGAFQKLMRAWADAIEQQMEAEPGGPKPGLGLEVVRRVPLPFGPDCGGDLPPALRDEITRRAQALVAGMSRGVTPEGVFGPHAAPGGPILLGPADQLPGWASRPRRRFTVSCGAVVVSVALAAGTMVAYWLANGP
jgi:hypothetical protein